jgi:hypothetical protein
LDGHALASVLTWLLCLTPSIGYECAGYEIARALARSGEVQLPPDASAWGSIAASHPAAVEPLSRWLAFFSAFTAPLSAALQAVLPRLPSTGAPVSAFELSGELEKAYELHAGLAAAALACPHLPPSWHLPAGLHAAAVGPSVMRAFQATSSRRGVVTAVLGHLGSMLEGDWPLGREGEEALYGAVAGAVNVWGDDVRARYGVGVYGSSKEYEGDVAREAATLLQLLEKVGDKDVADFTGGGQVSPASRALTVGLAVLLPALRPPSPLLAYWGVPSSFVGLVTGLMSRQPASAARLDPALFAALHSVLMWGVALPQVDVARSALEAVRGLASYHASARRRAAADPRYAALDLSSHFTHLPRLFADFVRPLLTLVLSHAPPPCELVTPIADALLALVHADAEGYSAAVTTLLDAQAPHLRARIGEEFNGLASGGGLVFARTIPGSGSPLAVRAAKALFVANFEAFVTRTRSLTSIL